MKPGELAPVKVTLERAAPQASAPASAPASSPPLAPASPDVPAPRGSTQRTLAWTAAGGAALLLAGGIVSTVVAAGAASHYNGPDCGVRPSVTCAGDVSRVHTSEAFEAVGYAGAGAAALVSAILFLAAPGTKPAKTGAWCAPAGAGVACGWTY